MNSRANIYNAFKKNSVNVDIRGFKKKQVWCPNKICNFSEKSFDILVQSEVDVAIVMKAMKMVFAN